MEVKGFEGPVFIKHNQLLGRWPGLLQVDVKCLHCGETIKKGSSVHSIPTNYDSISSVYTTFGFVCVPTKKLSCAKGYILEHPDFVSEICFSKICYKSKMTNIIGR